jgi:hypothetical protein
MTQRVPQPIPARLSPQLKVIPEAVPTDVREPQKVKSLRLPQAALLSVLGRKATKLDQARLVRM